METPKVIHDYLNTLRSQESSGREPMTTTISRCQSCGQLMHGTDYADRLSKDNEVLRKALEELVKAVEDQDADSLYELAAARQALNQTQGE